VGPFQFPNQPFRERKTKCPPAAFPAPWSFEDIGAAFVVKDGGGQMGHELLSVMPVTSQCRSQGKTMMFTEGRMP